jgi:hypothetical protein
MAGRSEFHYTHLQHQFFYWEAGAVGVGGSSMMEVGAWEFIRRSQIDV